MSPDNMKQEPQARDDRQQRIRRMRQLALELTDATLDIAAAEVAAFPDDVEAVERARSYLRAHLAGRRPRSIPERDLLFVAGTLLDVFGIDLDAAHDDRAAKPAPSVNELAAELEPAVEAALAERIAAELAARRRYARVVLRSPGWGSRLHGCSACPYGAMPSCPRCGLPGVVVLAAA